MRILDLAVVACLIAGHSAHALATERDTLAGFQDFRLGMNEQELRERVEIVESKPEAGGIRLKASKPTTIDEVAYSLSFLLKKNKLYRINLSVDRADPPGGCEGRFVRIFGLVKAKYGVPDKDPKRKVLSSGIGESFHARFTFLDGARIDVSTFKLATCLESVVYTAGLSGKSF